MWSHHHHYGCYPPAYTGVCHPHHGDWFGNWFTDAVYQSCCPVCWQPYHSCCCAPASHHHLPQELMVDTTTTSKDTFVGGTHDVLLTLEYMAVTGATSPSVKLKIEDSDGATDWEITSVPDGYHVKSRFASAAPGAKLTLEVTECLARLRWFEFVS